MSSEKNLKSAKTPKNKSREHGSRSVLVLSEREQRLLDVVQVNGYRLENVLRIALFLEETRGGEVVGPLDLRPLKAHRRNQDVILESGDGSESELELKGDDAPHRSEIVTGRGQTRRTRIKEARKELLKILVPEVDQVSLDDLRHVLERLAWYQSSKDWAVLAQLSPKLKDIAGPKLDLVKGVLSKMDLKALSEEKAKAVKASARSRSKGS
jgi:hypothetical protein